VILVAEELLLLSLLKLYWTRFGR